MQPILNVEKPTAQTYFKKIFQNSKLDWKDIYIYIYIIYIYIYIYNIYIYICINYYIIFYILMDALQIWKRGILILLFLHERAQKTCSSFSFLYKN